MLTVILILLPLHVLAAVFWAGSTFTLTRTGAAAAEQLFRPQMGAALLAFLTGGGMWGILHKSAFGPAEQTLAIGIVAAILAAGVQGMGTGPALRRLASDPAGARARLLTTNRIASVLLVVTLVTMVISRYV